MSEHQEAFIRRWFEEVWNKGREEAIDEMFAADGVAHGLSDEAGQPLRGPLAFKPFFRKFREAFPEIEVVVEETVCEGERVVARCTVRGHHRGDSLGFAATQRPIEMTGMCLVHLRHGQIAEAWNNFDFLALYQQLGALDTTKAGGDASPPPAQS